LEAGPALAVPEPRALGDRVAARDGAGRLEGRLAGLEAGRPAGPVVGLPAGGLEAGPQAGAALRHVPAALADLVALRTGLAAEG
jgi:hypothetical protein